MPATIRVSAGRIGTVPAARVVFGGMGAGPRLCGVNIVADRVVDRRRVAGMHRIVRGGSGVTAVVGRMVRLGVCPRMVVGVVVVARAQRRGGKAEPGEREEQTAGCGEVREGFQDRKSTRLNSSHG